MHLVTMTKDEIEKAVANVAATLKVEGLEQSPGAKKISTDYLNGNLNSCEAICKIKQLYGFK
jgi:hypothetical protein